MSDQPKTRADKHAAKHTGLVMALPEPVQTEIDAQREAAANTR